MSGALYTRAADLFFYVPQFISPHCPGAFSLHHNTLPEILQSIERKRKPIKQFHKALKADRVLLSVWKMPFQKRNPWIHNFTNESEECCIHLVNFAADVLGWFVVCLLFRHPGYRAELWKTQGQVLNQINYPVFLDMPISNVVLKCCNKIK